MSGIWCAATAHAVSPRLRGIPVLRSRALFLLAVTSLILVGLTAPAGAAARSGRSPAATSHVVAAVPRPDHVVVLIMENHSELDILGSPQAPYLNSLAAVGASMTQSFAVTHPSQPNYVALFSGSTNGVTDDSCPHTLTAPNLGAELIAAGLGFTTYSEGLPSAGFTGCTSGSYARKHNPAVNFALPATVNQPLTAFPTDYSTLPAVSYVIPNLQHDMHDGTVAQGDSWAQTTMKPYVTWAAEHNSIMIVTWDEDDFGSNNRIPTIVVGAGVTPGLYPEHINHYNVLRTLQDAYGLAPIGASATAAPILDIWSPPAAGAPQPAFTSTCTGMTCAVNGTASTGGSSAIAGLSWNWGDESTSSTGTTASHTYATAGDFKVTMTVTNTAGLSASATNAVSPRAAGSSGAFASDAFARSVASGFGNADVGGPWSLSGAASRFGVSAGVASMYLATAGTGLAASLNQAVSSDTDLTVSISTDKLATNNGIYVRLTGRHMSTNVEYQATIRIPGSGIPVLSIAAYEGSASAITLASARVGAGITMKAGSILNTRFQVTGTNPTSLRLKVWPTGSAEPANWQLTTSDSFAALQAPGSVGLGGYLSSTSTNAPVTLQFGSFSARPALASIIGAPVAVMTATCVDLTCSGNGTSSTAGAGSIASYSWSWGDGTVTTGSISSHTYTAAGSFPVHLTVTNNRGGTGSASQTATPTAPPTKLPFVSDTFVRIITNGWGSANVGGAWALTGGARNFSVSGGAGTVVLARPAAQITAYLPSERSSSTDFTATVSTDKQASNNGMYYTFTGRHVGTNLEYASHARVTAAGTVVLSLGALTGTATGISLTPQIVVSGLLIPAGAAMNSRVQVYGTNPTTVRAKVWAVTATEPAAWQLTATDAIAALQTSGSVGVIIYLSSGSANAPITARLTNLSAQPAAP